MTSRDRISTALEWVIIGHGVLALLFAIVTAIWLLVTWLAGPGSDAASQPLSTVLVLVGFVPVALVAAQRRKELVTGVASDRLKALYFISSGLALAASLVFFGGLAHDISLWFGHHGRFGCQLIDGGSGDLFFFDGRTLPWMLFVPWPLLAAALLWLRTRAVP